MQRAYGLYFEIAPRRMPSRGFAVRAGLRAACVCGLLVMSVLVLTAPKASADWCTSSTMNYSPSSGAPGTRVTFSFTFTNMISATIQVSDFSVSYSWAGISDFGVFVVGPFESITGTSAQTLPSTTGSESIMGLVSGQANTDPYGINCYFGPMPFTVTSTPPLSVSVQESAAATDVGLPVTFTCSPVGGTAPYNYSWAMGDGIGAWTQTVTHAYAISGSLEGSCEVRDNVGALATAVFTLLVHPAPTITLSEAQLTAAPGTSLPFDAVASGGSGGFAYAWSFGDGASGSTGNATHAYSAAGNFTANVTATDSAGGTASASVHVTITRIIATASASATTGGTGAAVTFIATAHGGAGGPYTFSWDFGDGSTGVGPTVTHVYQNPGTYTPKLTVKDVLNATTVTTLAAITIQGPFGVLGGALPIVLIGAAAAIAAVGAAVLLLRRRSKARQVPQEPKTPVAPPPQL